MLEKPKRAMSFLITQFKSLSTQEIFKELKKDVYCKEIFKAYRKHRAIQVLMWLTQIHWGNKANIGWHFIMIIMENVLSLIH